MMRSLFVAVLMLCLFGCSVLVAQPAIVRNGSIDVVIPDANCNLNGAGVSAGTNPITDGWSSATMGTPDLFRGCAPIVPLLFGIPMNTFTGVDPLDLLPDINPPNPNSQAYLGFLSSFVLGGEYREYVQNQLNVPLVVGQRYRLTMRVASLRGRTGSHFVEWSASPRALTKIHVVFSNRAYNRLIDPTQGVMNPAVSTVPPPNAPFPNVYQIVEIRDAGGFGNHDAVVPEQQWETVSVEFVCTVPGNAEFMTIGNLDDETEENSVPIDVPVQNDGNSVVTYTAIDDVKIESLTSPCVGCDKFTFVATRREEPDGKCCYDITFTNNSECVVDRVQSIVVGEVWEFWWSTTPPLSIGPGQSSTFTTCFDPVSYWKRFRLVDAAGNVLCDKTFDLKCGCECKDEIKISFDPVEAEGDKCCWKLSMKNMSMCGVQNIYGLTFEHPQIINKQGELTPLIPGSHANPTNAGLGGYYRFTDPFILDPLERVDVMKYCIDPDFADLPITIRLKRTDNFQEQCSTLVKEFKLSCKSSPDCCAAIQFERRSKAPWWDVTPHPFCYCGGFALWIVNSTTPGCAYTSVKVKLNGTTLVTKTGTAANPVLNLQNFYLGYFCYSSTPQTFQVEFTTSSGQVCTRTVDVPAGDCGGGPGGPLQKDRTIDRDRNSPDGTTDDGDLLPLRDGEVLRIFNVHGSIVYSSQPTTAHDVSMEEVTRDLSTGVYFCVVEGGPGSARARTITIMK